MKASINKASLKNVESKLFNLSQKIVVETKGGNPSSSGDMMSSEIVGELRDNINEQKFAGKYKPLSKSWKKHKQSVGASPLFWKYFGNLFFALHRWYDSEKKVWISGVQKGQKVARGSDSEVKRGRKITIYASANEQIRSLFGRTAKDPVLLKKIKNTYNRNILRIIKEKWKK